MTMAERLAVHEEIEMENRKKLLRWKVENIYRDMVRSGQYYEGRILLKLLRNGNVRLTLGDDGWNVECAVVNAGIPVRYSGDGMYCFVNV